MGMRALRAALVVNWINRRTAGCKGSNRCATCSLARSVASVYMVRSLEPMAKKSLSRARASAARAAPGTSIMMPSGGRGSGTAIFRLFKRFAAFCRSSRAFITSDVLETMGRRMRTGPWLAARSMARNWVSRMSDSISASRMPRRPSAVDWVVPKALVTTSAGLSAPTSRLRMVTGRPSIASTISRKIAYCSSSVGSVSRFM